ncbi:MAG: Rieske 2Fe-2S domain-containing protein [Rhodobacteraceae bacterium]|nr:Rieske 2Fe-2S domain-containing protein [Paracoccaceae bacterium]
MVNWIEVCGVDEIEVEGIKRFDCNGRLYIVCRSPDDDFFCLDGLCTHEKVDLSEGMIFEGELECPKHFGTFDYKTGAAIGAPVCINLNTYPVKVEGHRIYVRIE